MTLRPAEERKRMKIIFDVPGEPIPKARPRTVTQGGRIMTYTDARTRRAEGVIRTCFLIEQRKAGLENQPFQGPVRVHAEFMRSTARRCDLDNLLKTVLDAVNKVAFEDDQQVVEFSAKKGINREAPGSVVTIEEMP
jgi:Holliday junction resolvase RusA-like endonuclease